MRIRLILIVNLIAFLVISQIYLAISSNRVEDRNSYKVIHSDMHFEVRMYNPIAVDVINSKAFSFKEYSKTGIKHLAKFGLPDTKNKLNPSTTKYSNSLASQNTQESIISERMNLEENSEKIFVAVITFNGFACESDIKEYTRKMVMALNKANISHFGNYNFVSYNSNFQLFKRRNDIIVHINYNEELKLAIDRLGTKGSDKLNLKYFLTQKTFKQKEVIK